MDDRDRRVIGSLWRRIAHPATGEAERRAAQAVLDRMLAAGAPVDDPTPPLPLCTWALVNNNGHTVRVLRGPAGYIRTGAVVLVRSSGGGLSRQLIINTDVTESGETIGYGTEVVD